jgi:hypothetical protein
MPAKYSFSVADAEISETDNSTTLKLKSATDKLFITLPIKGKICNKFSVNLKISNTDFENIKSVAYGIVCDKQFYAIKIKHLYNQALRLDFDFNSIAFELFNENQLQKIDFTKIEKFRIIILGNLQESCEIELSETEIKKVSEIAGYNYIIPNCFQINFEEKKYKFPEDFSNFWQVYTNSKNNISSKFFDKYWHEEIIHSLKASDTNSDELMNEGIIYLTNLPKIKSDFNLPPQALAQTNNHQYRWHSLVPMAYLINSYEKTGNRNYLNQAWVFYERWAETNFYKKTENLRYCWYDHGTAERLMRLIRLWQHFVKEKFDVTSAARLLFVIYKHIELLGNPAFYARNQIYKYHNHAVFQFHSLILAGMEFSFLENTEKLTNQAVNLTLEQIYSLVGKDGASLENSSAYHDGMMGLVAMTYEILLNSSKYENQAKKLVDLHQRMKNFYQDLSYPDSSLPSFGDTNRKPNVKRNLTNLENLDNLPAKGLKIYESGFAFFEGKLSQNSNKTYQLKLINSSKTKIHKQNDNLHFTLWAGGIEWICDVGVHSYSENPHSKYCRTTQAHNAPYIENLPYTPSINNTKIVSFDNVSENCHIQLQHKCYQELKVLREVNFGTGNGEILIKDIISKRQNYSLNFTFGDEVEANVMENIISLTSKLTDTKVFMVFDKKCKITINQNSSEENEIYGWFYPAMNIKQASISARIEVENSSESKFYILIDALPKKLKELGTVNKGL